MGVYLEIVPFDGSHTRQGTALAKALAIHPETLEGQWLEVSFLAVSDSDLEWWLNHGGELQATGNSTFICAPAKNVRARRKNQEDLLISIRTGFVRSTLATSLIKRLTG